MTRRKQNAETKTTLKPGSARVSITDHWGDTRFFGGSAEDAIIFRSADEARDFTVNTPSHHDGVLVSWEIQTLRADGLWQGCVTAGEFRREERGAA